ncbi:MAG: hypothetical protein RJB62_504 [Pseudomonadota bacterium]|jgi:DNA-binding response OmpR family regulator
MANILLIDDDDLVRRSVAAHLEAADHVVTLAGDGGAALKILGAETFDLIITDLLMPELEGMEFIRLARRSSVVPIIAMTGAAVGWRPTETSPGADYLAMAYRLGATKTLRKPFSPKQLLDLVDECLGFDGTRRSGP